MEIKKIDFTKSWTEEMSIFSSAEFLNSLGEKYGWIGGYKENKLVYFLPYIKKRKLFIFNYVQLYDSINSTNSEKNKEEEIEFLNRTISFFKKENIDFLICPSTNALFKTVPNLNSVKKCKFGSYILDLNKSEEELWENLNGKHRNVIRKAMKNNLYVNLNEKDLKSSYKILEETLNRSKMSMGSYKKLEKIINILGPDKIKVVSVYEKDKIQGVAIFLYSKYRVYYWYGGSIENISTGAMNLLHWEAIKYFKSIGVKTYDFLGARIKPKKNSKLEGIQRFKERFGCEMEKGYLWKISLNDRKLKYYELLIGIKNFIKKSMYKGDIIDQELLAGRIESDSNE